MWGTGPITHCFWGRISPHFNKPVARFIGDMVYGIMAEKNANLSSAVRVCKEGITPKKIEDELGRMLSFKGLERGLHDAIADGASDIRKGRCGRWRRFAPAEAEKEADASLFAFFGGRHRMTPPVSFDP